MPVFARRFAAPAPGSGSGSRDATRDAAAATSTSRNARRSRSRATSARRSLLDDSRLTYPLRNSSSVPFDADGRARRCAPRARSSSSACLRSSFLIRERFLRDGRSRTAGTPRPSDCDSRGDAFDGGEIAIPRAALGERNELLERRARQEHAHAVPASARDARRSPGRGLRSRSSSTSDGARELSPSPYFSRNC